MVSIERSMAEEEVIPVCENCGTEMKRVYYAAPVKFNGTGFYSTGG
jgi:predicted nucleic acid-binding Zn ribbon protein